MRTFTLALALAAAGLAAADDCTQTVVYGVCYSDFSSFSTSGYPAHTTTSTLPLTTTTTYTSYVFPPRQTEAAPAPPAPTAAPVEERSPHDDYCSTVYVSNVCSETVSVTVTHWDSTPVATLTATATAFLSTETDTTTYTLCIPGNICIE